MRRDDRETTTNIFIQRISIRHGDQYSSRANTYGVNECVENKSRKVAFAMTRRTTRYVPILQSQDNGMTTGIYIYIYAQWRIYIC